MMDQRRRATQRRVMNMRTLTVGFHHGCLQVIPPSRTFPRMTCKQLIDNWFVGNKIEKIPPLELLSALHVAHLGAPRNQNYGKVKPIRISW